MYYSFFSQLWKSKRFFTSLQLGIMIIAIVPLVLVQQFTRNMIEEISKRIIETSSGHIQMVFDKRQQIRPNVFTIKKNLASIPHIESVFLEIQGGGILRKGTRRTGVNIRGVEKNWFLEKNFVRYTKVIAGTLSLMSDKDIILGKSIAQDLQTKVADTILLLTIQSQNPTLPPKITRFTVRGIFTTDYKELDRSWVFVSDKVAQNTLSPQDQRWFINIKTKNAFMFPNTIQNPSKKDRTLGNKILINTKNILNNYGSVYSWYEKNANQFNLFANTRVLLNLVLFIALLLATITVSSTMGLRVLDLETDIALLKSIGADPKTLEHCLFFQGLSSGIISAGFGSIIGLGLSISANFLITSIDFIINIARSVLGKTSKVSLLSTDYYLQDLSFHVYINDLLLVIVFTIVLSVCATYFPARRLRNIPAMKILRQH